MKDVLGKGKKGTGKLDNKQGGKFAKKSGANSDVAVKTSDGAAKGKSPDGKKVVKSSNSNSTGAKKDFKKKPSGDATEKRKFKPKPKAKKPMTPEERKMAKPHYKLVSRLILEAA